MKAMLNTCVRSVLVIGMIGLFSAWAQAQEAQDVQDAANDTKQPSNLSERVEDAVDQTKESVKEMTAKVDESEKAKEISAGILNPIYALSEKMAFPAFYWVAFALMATGVVSYALQLVLGKLVVLTRLSFSISEVLSDALGLLISLVGLVLTTQAAAQNSTFATSAFAVLSASAVGLAAGIVFYFWGQSQELAAAAGHRARAAETKS